MRKSSYKTVIPIICLVGFAALLLVSIYINTFGLKNTMTFSETLGKYVYAIINNNYVSSIVSSIVAIAILYYTQLWYCKARIKRDFRCNEVLNDLSSAIEEALNLYSEWKEETSTSSVVIDGETSQQNKEHNEDYEKHANARSNYDFYSKNKSRIEICNDALTYRNNDILIDSVQSTFFVNINFRLLDIINNIKSRRSKFRSSIDKIAELNEKFEESNDLSFVMRYGSEMREYFVDLRFMADYYYILLEYLEFDPAFTKLFSAEIDRMYPDITELLNLPVEVRNRKLKAIEKLAKKDLLKHKWRKIFSKK